MFAEVAKKDYVLAVGVTSKPELVVHFEDHFSHLDPHVHVYSNMYLYKNK